MNFSAKNSLGCYWNFCGLDIIQCELMALWFFLEGAEHMEVR
jgi:hypothetical protein